MMQEKEWIVKELKKVTFIAAPMVVVSVSQYLLSVVSLIMAGHLGNIQLSGVAIATTITNSTGFSIILGLSGALETLCGQAYGAGQYRKLGSYTYCSLICLLPICIPISILWIFMDKLLFSVGLDPHISRVAGKYAMVLIPTLFGFVFYQSLLRYYQTQSLILPVLLSSCATFAIHIPLCWAFIYKWEFGDIGGAVSIGLSSWFNVILLAFYMRCSSSCKKTRILCWKEIFSSIRDFWRFAIPTAVMVCLEWWTFGLLTLMAGFLPHPELENSVLSVCITSTSIHYFVQCGLSAAASTRVSNELGSGNPEAARSVVRVVLTVSITEAILVSTAVFSCRKFFGYAFSNDKKVVKYIIQMAPFLCLSIIMDSLQIVLSGIVRGSGLQRIGAFINLGAYYFVGIPVSVVLCFVVNLRSKGLWIGVLTGSTFQAALLGIITALTNWEKQATKAKDRIFKEQIQQTLDATEP